MAKTSKPLWIILSQQLLASIPSAKLAELREKGHRIQDLSSATGEELELADLVLSPNCFRMFPETTKYLDAAIKGARAVAYPPKGGKA